jgi:hypothetical protein
VGADGDDSRGRAACRRQPPPLVLTGTAADAFGRSCRWLGRITAVVPAWRAAQRAGRFAGIPIEIGANIITITARDAAGLIGTDAVTVTRTDGDCPHGGRW